MNNSSLVKRRRLELNKYGILSLRLMKEFYWVS